MRLSGILLAATCVFLSISGAQARDSGDTDHNWVQVCTGGETVATAVPYSACSDVTDHIPTGFLDCSTFHTNGNNSGDFAGGASCSAQTRAVTSQNCTTEFKITYTTTQKVCVLEDIPIVEAPCGRICGGR